MPEVNYKKIWLIGFGIVLYFFISAWVFVPLIKAYRIISTSSLATAAGGKIPDLSEVWALYKSPFLCLGELIDGDLFGTWLIISLIALGLLLVLAYTVKNKNTGIEYLPDVGTHGTAGFMTKDEAEKVLNIGTPNGIIFGKLGSQVVSLPPDAYFNRHVAVFGASGSMKSRAYVRTNILQMAKEGHSMIMTDPKGELVRDTTSFLQDMGYTVRVFNLVNMTKSDRWNPIGEIANDIDAQTFTEVVIANTKIPGAKGSDPFWDRAEQNLLKALVMYVVKEYMDGEKNLASVYSLIGTADPKKIDRIFNALPANHPAKMPYNIYAQANDTVRTGVVIGLGTRLQVFQNSLVQQLTATSDINLTQPGREKCAYFAVFPDTDSTFDFLAGLYFSFIFIKLMRYADANGGHGDKDVYFLLDEFPNIGAIPDFTKKISTMRSRGLHASIVFQNIAQLKNRYPNDAWQEIIGNCDSRLFLGATDVMTSQFVADLLGKSTVKTVNTRKKAGLEGMFDFGDISYGTSQRNLLNADEILRLAPNKEILVLRGQKPLLLDKMDYTTHPLAKRLRPQQSYEPSSWSAAEPAADDLVASPDEPAAAQKYVHDLPSEEHFW
jgi:type IV secretion system protein VirD4